MPAAEAAPVAAERPCDDDRVTAPALSPDYRTARAAFLAAAESAGARRTSVPHPRRGLHGEELAVDFAELGPHDAEHVVLVVSGTHGVEGYCGSALQTAWLAHHAGDRPDDARVVLLHAFNPFGFSWVRRVNEDHVDLNRNFVDWTEPPPHNPDYDEIADLLVSDGWTDAEQERTTGALLERAAEWGFERTQAVISQGQYRHPAGVFYGGTGPVWSHRLVRAWAADGLAPARRLQVIDLHTGLGPWGHGELVGHTPKDDPAHERAVSSWGDVRSMVDGESVSAVLHGDWLATLPELAPAAEITAAALEFGTVDPVTVLQSLRADAWLHTRGDPTAPEADAIRAQVRAAFADDDPAWVAACWDRFAGVLGACWS